MNHLTHFRKITILRFVLAGLVLLFSVPALCADGIASRYPNDVGIGNDPDVILYDGFENYTSPSQLSAKWQEVANPGLMRIATEPGNFAAGKKALEMRLAITSGETGASIARLSLQEPVLYVRTYEKWDVGWNPINGHNGITLRGGPFLGPGMPAKRDGTSFFTFLLENGVMHFGGEHQPGYSHIYAYWPYQQFQYGDHWLPNGYNAYNPGLWLLYPAQYPNFVAMPNWQPYLGVWYCHEFMVKLNTVGQRNGEVAFWINGQLKGRWTNLFIRSIDSLKINLARLMVYSIGSSRVNKKWYDSVVIAREYIGPISPPGKSDFNGDGKSDILWQNTSTGQRNIWIMNGTARTAYVNLGVVPTSWSIRNY
jgi:hypothetical protein